MRSSSIFCVISLTRSSASFSFCRRAAARCAVPSLGKLTFERLADPVDSFTIAASSISMRDAPVRSSSSTGEVDFHSQSGSSFVHEVDRLVGRSGRDAAIRQQLRRERRRGSPP
jgi:hypothetical protein